MNKLSIVKDVIDEWDPQNFLKSGCPDDEYEVEIQGIVEVLEIVNGPKELAIEINQIFNKAFDTDFKKEKECFVVAPKILRLFN
ncbi:DUF1871 family protein [Bacillus cihuensis]|uniref:DUF1871 family protein n=1 Tax=Bacillus cihuensis TaxID=1208599 RepID=UPI0004051A8D|nr:DUF1871 family protein [Bacillus cihuensis]